MLGLSKKLQPLSILCSVLSPVFPKFLANSNKNVVPLNKCILWLQSPKFLSLSPWLTIIKTLDEVDDGVIVAVNPVSTRVWFVLDTPVDVDVWITCKTLPVGIAAGKAVT